MPDREYKIKILTVADPTGAQQTKEGLAEVTSATEKGTRANEEHSHSFLHAESSGRQFHKILHEITDQSPLLGIALRLALNPTTAALTGLIIAFHEFNQAQEEAQKRAADNASETAQQFVDEEKAAAALRDKVVEAAEKFKQDFQELATAQHSAKANTDAVTDAIGAQQKALEGLLKAQEAYELAQTKDEGARAEIRLRYAGKNAAVAQAAAADLLAAREKEFADAQKRAPELAAATAAAVAADTGQGGAFRRTDIATREADIARLEKQVKDAEAALAKAQPGSKAELKATTDADIAKSALQSSYDILARDKAQAAEAAARAENARKAELDNQRIIEKDRADLPGLRARFGLESATRSAEQIYGRGADLPGEFDRAAKQLAQAGSAGNIAGVVEATMALAILPAKLKAFADAAARANAAVDEAIGVLNQRVRSTVNP